MKQLLNNLFQGVVAFQHTHAPLPLPLFDGLFRLRLARRVAGRYGQACFNAHYHQDRMEVGNLDYWMSKDSLYWHFWRQTDTSPDAIRIAQQLAPPLRDKTLKAAELGFGIGKNRFFHKDLFPFERYVGVEPNTHCAAVARSRMPSIEVRELTIMDFIDSKEHFDILLVFGGVLMYMPPNDVDRLFVALGERDLKCVLILDEGVGEGEDDDARSDGTIMYNFQKRLSGNGYGDRQYYLEAQNNRPINRIFAMW
jgi:hypothetical protein